jgi:hypothetical protein
MTRIENVDFDLATVASFAAFDWHGGLHVEELSVAHIRFNWMRCIECDTQMQSDQTRKDESIGRWYRSIPWHQRATSSPHASRPSTDPKVWADTIVQ